MLPMVDVRMSLGDLLAADASTLAPPVDANNVILFTNPVTPTENLVIADLTEATFDGYGSISVPVGAQLTGIDPATGDQLITIKEPAGGWRWKMTGTSVPTETIYGFALTNKTKTVLLAVELLPNPVTLNAINQQINIGSVTLTFVARPIS